MVSESHWRHCSQTILSGRLHCFILTVRELTPQSGNNITKKKNSGQSGSNTSMTVFNPTCDGSHLCSSPPSAFVYVGFLWVFFFCPVLALLKKTCFKNLKCITRFHFKKKWSRCVCAALVSVSARLLNVPSNSCLTFNCFPLVPSVLTSCGGPVSAVLRIHPVTLVCLVRRPTSITI